MILILNSNFIKGAKQNIHIKLKSYKHDLLKMLKLLFIYNIILLLKYK